MKRTFTTSVLQKSGMQRRFRKIKRRKNFPERRFIFPKRRFGKSFAGYGLQKW